MFSLILALSTIALLSALAVVAINYTPGWPARAKTAHELTASGVARLERAYDLASAAATPVDTPPPPTASGDGGAELYFRPYIGFMPRAPVALGWVYGRQPNPGAFNGMDYFCLAGVAVAHGEYAGLARFAQALGPEQAILAASCGAQASSAVPASFPTAVALTYYVQYVSGIP